MSPSYCSRQRRVRDTNSRHESRAIIVNKMRRVDLDPLSYPLNHRKIPLDELHRCDCCRVSEVEELEAQRNYSNRESVTARLLNIIVPEPILNCSLLRHNPQVYPAILYPGTKHSFCMLVTASPELHPSFDHAVRLQPMSLSYLTEYPFSGHQQSPSDQRSWE